MSTTELAVKIKDLVRFFSPSSRTWNNTWNDSVHNGYLRTLPSSLSMKLYHLSAGTTVKRTTALPGRSPPSFHWFPLSHPILTSFAGSAKVLLCPTVYHIWNQFLREFLIALTMETACTSETSVNFTRLHGATSQSTHLHTRRRENLISHQV
jgi:hypothetical protein